MKTTYIIILLASIYLLGCNSNKWEPKRLVQLNYYGEQYIEDVDSLYEFITDIDTLYLDRILKNDTLSFTYKLLDESITLSFSKFSKNDSSIVIYGHESKLQEKKTYKIGSHSYTIFKYYYDLPNSIDEESSYFYHEDYGILVGYNNGWSDLIFSMIYDSNSRIMVDSIIRDQAFLNSYASKPPPPPPPKLDSIECEEKRE